MSLTYDITISSSTSEWHITDGDSSHLGGLEITNSAKDMYQTGLIKIYNPDESLTIGNKVDVDINSINEFSGYIARIQQSLAGTNTYNVQLIGKTYDLWRQNVDDTGVHTFFNDYTTNFIIDLVDSQTDIGTSSIPINTGTFMSGSYDFTNHSVGETIRTLADFDGYYFYVNSGGNLKYYGLTSNQSITILESQIESHSPFQMADDQIYNDVIVVGGANISARASSQTSIDAYGRHRYKVNYPTVTNSQDAQQLADQFVLDYKDPTWYGDLTIAGNQNITIGKTFNLNLTNMDISGSQIIKSYTHLIDKNGFTTKISFGREQYDPSTDYSELRSEFTEVYDGIGVGLEKSFVFAQASQPTAFAEGDVWIETDNNNFMRVWNGTTWTDARHGNLSGNTKSTVFRQTSSPTATNIGDIWIDTDNSNYMYTWNGSTWVDSRHGDYTGALKNTVFRQTTTPTALKTGDIWVDTDDSNKMYQWNGSSWVDSRHGDYTADQNHSVLNNIGADDHHVSYLRSSIPSAVDFPADYTWYRNTAGVDRFYYLGIGATCGMQEGNIWKLYFKDASGTPIGGTKFFSSWQENDLEAATGDLTSTGSYAFVLPTLHYFMISCNSEAGTGDADAFMTYMLIEDLYTV
jgi:hypothetical protein